MSKRIKSAIVVETNEDGKIISNDKDLRKNTRKSTDKYYNYHKCSDHH